MELDNNIEEEIPLIISLDDDIDVRMLIEVYLSNAGYKVLSVATPTEALEAIKTRNPSLILLDVIMPEMNGYEFCARLQESKETSTIPVIFLTSLWEEMDKAKAFSVGASDYLNKPIKRDQLLQKVEEILQKSKNWEEMSEDNIPFHLSLSPTYFDDFIKFLQEQLVIPEADIEKLNNMNYHNIYSVAAELGITSDHLAQYIGGFLNLPYMKIVNPNSLEMGLLSTQFCRSKGVVPIRTEDSELCFVLSNPFDWDMLDWIAQVLQDKEYHLAITEPKNLQTLFEMESGEDSSALSYISKDEMEKLKMGDDSTGDDDEELDEDMSPIIYIADKLIRKAVTDNASDIHIEPKMNETLVRFRIDGDMIDILKLKKRTGTMLLTRLKAIGHLDISEREKPQDGSVETTVGGINVKMRLATTSTPDGESLVMRVLKTEAEVKSFETLGMTPEQAKNITTLANHTQGLILIVGPTGSGKTTTIYSLLSLIDCQSRSLLSIEDPVEYRIPYANQQQINVKRGVTFESLLKSVVRQDPDIMFLGEVRDAFSANIALDFASTGHLTITSLHTNNAVTAIFRLERLEIERSVMSDAMVGIIAQRLVKRPCPYCKKIEAPTEEEIEILQKFTKDIPEKVVHTIGCLKCNNSGYGGREGVYEVMLFDPEISERIRSGMAIPDIRKFLVQRGDYLISTHALDKIRNHTLTVTDAYKKVLIEDLDYYLDINNNNDESNDIEIDNNEPIINNIKPIANKIEPAVNEINNNNTFSESKIESVDNEKELPTLIGVNCRKKKDLENAAKAKSTTQKSILIVDDDEDVRILLNHYLSNNYTTTLAEDGVDALLKLGAESFDIIISDVDMPNLDGFKLMEMLNMKGITTPVVFLTANNDAEHELEGLRLGAADYLKKPLDKDILLMRMKRLLNV